MEFHVKFGTLSNIYVFLDTSACGEVHKSEVPSACS